MKLPPSSDWRTASGAGKGRDAPPDAGPAVSEPGAQAGAPDAAGLRWRLPPLGLPTKLLLLTIVFVMLAEVCIFVPSIANFRRNWLMEKLTAAQIAALAVEVAPKSGLPMRLRTELLKTAGVHGVALKRNEFRQLVMQADPATHIDDHYDLTNSSSWSLVRDSIKVFFASPDRIIRVIGVPEMHAGASIEIVMDEKPLQDAMIGFALRILGLSIVISIITAALVYLSLHFLLIRPMTRLTWNMVRFSERPEDVSAIILPSGRRDEIGVAEAELAAMQWQISSLLKQKSRLAALGLAMSKINHDLRNMLSSAQLISDRLSGVADPTVQRFAPKLILSLGRAIQLCTQTLTYGRAQEPPPKRALFPLEPLVDEVAEALGLPDHAVMRWVSDIQPGLMIDADRGHLYRVIANLLRNASQVMDPGNGEAPGASPMADAPEIRLAAWREKSIVVIVVSDNGPGVPQKVREHLFQAFKGSVRKGGTGLGLAISAELTAANGGSIRLQDSAAGASFRIEIPDRMDEGALRRSA
jgi:signal transduction histidine kinase